MASTYKRDPYVRWAATIVFAVAIAAVGAVMMGLTSSPAAKGAALLWLPAALQLLAGVWLGPWRGAAAGGIGAYAAGIIAYGGWGPPDIIQNLIAGGLANSFLPAILFRLLRVDPAFEAVGRRPGLLIIVFLLTTATALAFLQRPILTFFGLDSGTWGYFLPLIVVALAPFLLGTKLGSGGRFALAALIIIVSCFVSAAIGVVGAIVAGQTLVGAVVAVGVGWFLGDTVSALIGLYVMATLTPWARESGIAPLDVPPTSA